MCAEGGRGKENGWLARLGVVANFSVNEYGIWKERCPDFLLEGFTYHTCCD